MSVNQFIRVAVLATVAGLGVSIASAQTVIPTVPIGNPGNAPDTVRPLGSVAYTYNIGTTEVTNAQYAAFLNAKGRADNQLLNLYDTRMSGNTGGIVRSGFAGSYTYSTIAGRENNPVNYVSYWDATRFVNWLHNGQGDGDTESGAYPVGGLFDPGEFNRQVPRSPDARWAIPTRNEWYKAAFHQPASQGGDVDDYWLYSTSSNTLNASQANVLNSGINNTVSARSYAANFYGTFDMCGNVSEWTDEQSFAERLICGGSYLSDIILLRSSFGGGADGDVLPTSAFESIGFRVVQVPGPSSVVLLAFGTFLTARRRR